MCHKKRKLTVSATKPGTNYPSRKVLGQRLYFNSSIMLQIFTKILSYFRNLKMQKLTIISF